MHLDPAPDSSIIAAMMPAYLRELTPDGPFEYPQLARYWDDPGRYAYLIRAGAHDAGFVLVRHHPETAAHELAEFYVAPPWRRRGLGHAAAIAAFARHPGRWHLQILADNHAAQAFWRGVVPALVHEERRLAANGRAYSLLLFRWEAGADGRSSENGSYCGTSAGPRSTML
jgi:predicted acetyltransferase